MFLIWCNYREGGDDPETAEKVQSGFGRQKVTAERCTDWQLLLSRRVKHRWRSYTVLNKIVELVKYSEGG